MTKDKKEENSEKLVQVVKKEQRMSKCNQNMKTSGVIYGVVHSTKKTANNVKKSLLFSKQGKYIGQLKTSIKSLQNKVAVQSKYCSTGAKCISECFHNGKFLYFNSDGTPMQIEVPADKYQEAIKSMELRIQVGEVKGISNPKSAKQLVRKGKYTYRQVKNLAKSGMVDNLILDVKSGMITSAMPFGISSLITFGICVWNGDTMEQALKQGLRSGISVGGLTFLSSVIANQITRTSVNKMLLSGSEAMIARLGPKATTFLVNTFHTGKNLYGAAAMKSAAKMLRNNIITGTISVVLLSSGDLIDIFRGRISVAQLLKNMINTATTIVGGTAGWALGANLGIELDLLLPDVGFVVGSFFCGLVGSFAGGSVAGKISGTILDNFIEDDVKKMLSILEEEFTQLAIDYLLNREESERVVDQLAEKLNIKLLKDMYANVNPREYARQLLVELVEQEIAKRQKIAMPTEDEISKSLNMILDEMSNIHCCSN